MADNMLSKSADEAERLRKTVESANGAVETLSKTMLTGGKGFENIVSAADQLSGSMKGLGESFNNIAGKGLGFEKIGKGVEKLTGVMGGAGQIVKELGSSYVTALNSADSFSAGLRGMDMALFEVGSSFGSTLQEAKDFTDYIGNSSREVASAQFGYINVDELQNFSKSMMSNRISMERQKDTIVSTAGSMDLLTSSILQAQASGLSAENYMSKLGDAIMKQGLSSQEAAEQMASFRGVAEETGLTTSSVSDTLNSLANNFSKIGLSADFGRSLLVGFSRTMNDMGLGIENAIDLSASLSSALAGLTSDYSTAFITAQRGGLDLGSGSVLGAGIGLEARMLKAQKEGDTGAQEKLGMDLTLALKDTIASFSGGEIITAQQASESPGLETAYYTQKKLLQDMYGLDEQTSGRTLDYLSDLNKSIKEGDMDTANELAKQVSESIKNRNENLQLLDKQNALTAALLTEATVQTRALLTLPRLMMEEGPFSAANKKMTSELDDFAAGAKNLQKDIFDKIAGGESKSDALVGGLSKWVGSTPDIEIARNKQIENIAKKSVANNNAANAGEGAISDGMFKGLSEALINLTREIQNLTTQKRSSAGAAGVVGSNR